MAIKLITHAAPAWLRELTTARTNYEELHGWPAVVEVSSRCLKLPVGQAVDAVRMPAALGELVQFQLQVMMLDGPVIAGPQSGWLTFLTEAATSAHPLLPPDLEPALVRLVPHGEHIVLPIAATTHRLRDVRWLNPPRPCRKPPGWSAVIGASRRVVATRTVDDSVTLAA
jgi:hypothetical protein